MIVFLFNSHILAQGKEITYHFEVKNPIYIKSTGLYIGKEFEFYSIREFTSDSTFIDKGLLNNNLDVGYEFKKGKNNRWYIKNNNEWILFFYQNINYIGTIEISGISYSIHWSHACFWEHSRNYIFELIPPKNMDISHLPTYIFNYEFGIIGLENSDGQLLLRKDMMYEIN